MLSPKLRLGSKGSRFSGRSALCPELGVRDPTRPDIPYAELWMGTHESGPSFVVQAPRASKGVSVDDDVGVSLKKWISENPNVLGDKVLHNWGCDLPFLFKVLSMAKASSIQAHPNKQLARRLHKGQPDPEMALAITEFEALCGFISLEELKGVLCYVPEIVDMVGSAYANQILHINEQDGEEKVKSILRSIFTKLMLASKEMITKVLSNIKSHLQIESQPLRRCCFLIHNGHCVIKTLVMFNSIADVGVISAFFFNYVKLNPGEALYLGADEPHAYVSGECIECMATSDNVVWAGLTPKHRDVKTLCSMLTYKQGFPLNSYVRRYLPLFDEFVVDQCILPCGASTVFPAVLGPSIFLVMAGEGIMHAGSFKGELVTEGDVLFAPANTEISKESESELQLYRAGVNDRFFQDSL
ncbi:hypothetical protein ACB092_04G072300 [Castanea dentata]